MVAPGRGPRAMDDPAWRWGSGPQPLRTYFSEILPAAAEVMEGYAVLSVERDVVEDLVVSRIRSTHGHGVLVFRTADDRLTDVYVISGASREQFRPF